MPRTLAASRGERSVGLFIRARLSCTTFTLRGSDGQSLPYGLSALPLFALFAEARPRHRFETRLRDGMLAGRADAICAAPHTREGLFDGSQKPPVSLMQTDLKFRLGIGIGLVDEITLAASCSWHTGPGGGLGGGRE